MSGATPAAAGESPAPAAVRLHADAQARVSAFTPADPGQAHARARTLAFLAEHPDAVEPSCRAGHVTATAVVLSPDRRRTLLTLHPRVQAWLELGGHVEPADADLPAAALREATEESGLQALTVDAPLLTIAVFDNVPCRRSPGATHFDLVYAVTAPADARPVRSAESLDLGWFDVDRLPEPLGVGVAEHVDLALAACIHAPSRRAPSAHASSRHAPSLNG